MAADDLTATDAAVPACGDADGTSARRRILRAALGVFAEFGFAGAATREIARRAGVHQPALAYHFGSKEELWKSAAGTVFAELMADLQAGMDEAHHPDARLRGFTRRFVRFVAANPEWYSFVIHEAKQSSDRNDWLVDTWFQPMVQLFYEALTAEPWPHGESPAMARAISMMALLAGSTSLFVQRGQLLRLAGVDTLSPDFIDLHAESILIALTALIHAPDAAITAADA